MNKEQRRIRYEEMKILKNDLIKIPVLRERDGDAWKVAKTMWRLGYKRKEEV